MNQALTFKKTRIAPTPSGFLHLGNVFSFALTAALAKKTGAAILLRIDDLDRGRVDEAYVQDIFDTLHFMEIPWHEGPRNLQEYRNHYTQLRRLDNYNMALQQLSSGGHVYACACSRAQILKESQGGAYPGTCRHKNIPLHQPGVNWRLKTTAETTVGINTLNDKRAEYRLPATVQDVIVRKKDGMPAYQLCSVIDDIHFGIDLVVRGSDLWDSTLAQLYLAGLLNATSFLNATFYHHPLLLSDQNKKLSKSAGDTSIQFLRRQYTNSKEVYGQLAQLLNNPLSLACFEDFGELLSL